MDNNGQSHAGYWLITVFAVGFFAVGVPYWQIPYAKVSLPSTLYGPGLLVIGVLAAAACAVGKARILTAILTVGAAVPAAILARVEVETARDPTSHNLWPLEVIIAVVVGVLCSSAGAVAVSLFARLSRRHDTA